MPEIDRPSLNSHHILFYRAVFEASHVAPAANVRSLQFQADSPHKMYPGKNTVKSGLPYNEHQEYLLLTVTLSHLRHCRQLHPIWYIENTYHTVLCQSNYLLTTS